MIVSTSTLELGAGGSCWHSAPARWTGHRRGWWTWAGYKADAGERLCLAAVHLTECSWPGSGEAGSCT
ncbi:hypothetical protein BV881_08030 [Streptomyces sp. ZL-24]|nr:hypothetical protein BV881_08030 [Streptomyces sp. ZL-24]